MLLSYKTLMSRNLITGLAIFPTITAKLDFAKQLLNTATWSQIFVYPKKYAHGFVVLSFVVVMQSFIMNSHEVFIHIHQGCFAGTGAIVRLPQCQWSKPGGYGKISQCITTTKHSKAKTVCIFLGIYCIYDVPFQTTLPHRKWQNTVLKKCAIFEYCLHLFVHLTNIDALFHKLCQALG